MAAALPKVNEGEDAEMEDAEGKRERRRRRKPERILNWLLFEQPKKRIFWS